MTPHIEAKKGEIAKTVIMSGDPLRAKFIAEKYLDDFKIVNKVRGMFAYTGSYKGKEVTIMGHGMGMAGSGIYFYELFKIYDVERIIRVGSCGTFKETVNIFDIILVDEVFTLSNYAYVLSDENTNLEKADLSFNNKVNEAANSKNINLINGTIMTSDVFDAYVDTDVLYSKIPKELDIIGVDMECFALMHIARKLNKSAACLLTVVDSICKKIAASSEDREKALTNMIEVALESILL